MIACAKSIAGNRNILGNGGASGVCVVTITWRYLKIDCYTFKYSTFEHHNIFLVFGWVSIISFTHLANNRDTPGTEMSVSLHALSLQQFPPLLLQGQLAVL